MDLPKKDEQNIGIDHWQGMLDDAFGGEEQAPKTETVEATDTPETAQASAPITPKKRRTKGKAIWGIILAALLVAAVVCVHLIPRSKPSPELELCKNALAQWQQYESYCIMCETRLYGNSPENTNYSAYIRSGENVLSMSISNLGNDIRSYDGRLNLNGRSYSCSMFFDTSLAGSFDDVIYGIMPNKTWHSKDEYSEIPAPWPMTFSWNDETASCLETEYYSAQEDAAIEHVTVIIRESLPEPSYYQFPPYYTVQFSFDTQGQLTKITQHLTDWTEGHESIMTLTYTLYSTDADAIADNYFNNLDLPVG